MNHRIPPIEQKNTPNIDELKENFRKHDFTAKASTYEPNPKTEQEKTTYGLAQNIFAEISGAALALLAVIFGMVYNKK